MADPFSDVDAASPEMIEIIVAGLEIRAADPSMLPVIDAMPFLRRSQSVAPCRPPAASPADQSL